MLSSIDVGCVVAGARLVQYTDLQPFSAKERDQYKEQVAKRLLDGVYAKRVASVTARLLKVASSVMVMGCMNSLQASQNLPEDGSSNLLRRVTWMAGAVVGLFLVRISNGLLQTLHSTTTVAATPSPSIQVRLVRC